MDYVSEPGCSKSDILYAVVSFSVSTKEISKYYYNEISETSAADRRLHHTVILANIRVCTYARCMENMNYLLRNHFVNDKTSYF